MSQSAKTAEGRFIQYQLKSTGPGAVGPVRNGRLLGHRLGLPDTFASTCRTRISIGEMFT